MKKLIKVIAMTAMLASFHQMTAAGWLNWSNYSKITGIVQVGSDLWVAGHDGVVKIDTATLQKTYYTKTTGQLPSLMVEDITYVASTGDIWIGTYDAGIIQVRGGQWTTYPYPAGTMLYHFAADAAGTIWCAMNNGLYKFASDTFAAVPNPIVQDAWDVKVFPNGKLLIASIYPIIYDPVIDTAITVHTTVVTYNPSYIYIENDSSYYFTATPFAGISHMVDTTEYYITDSLVLDNSMSDQVIQMKVVNNHLTALTMNSKLFQYNGATWAADPHNSDAQAVSATFLYQDPNSNEWLGGPYNGGTVRPLDGGADISLKKFGLVSNIVTAVCDKSSSEIWVMAGNEIGIYDKSTNAFSQVFQLPVATYSNLFNASGMTVWNGVPTALTDSGLYQYSAGAWTGWNISGLPNVNYMLCLASDSSGSLYIGTLNGIYVVNGTNVTAYTSVNTPALAGNDVIRKAWFDAGRNTMWFAMSSGIVRFSNGAFTLINGSNYPQLINYSYISAITQDPAGNMWFGTAYGGLIEYDGTNYILDSLPLSAGNQSVNAIAFDGTTMYAGDNVYGFWAKQNGTWTNYSTANSNLTSNNISGFYVDDQHDVWITSQNYGNIETFGIDIFNPAQVTLAVAEVHENPLSAYPNPAQGRLMVSAADVYDGSEVMLSDALGRAAGIYQVSGGGINISALSPGVYFLRVAGLAAPSLKIVKE